MTNPESSPPVEHFSKQPRRWMIYVSLVAVGAAVAIGASFLLKHRPPQTIDSIPSQQLESVDVNDNPPAPSPGYLGPQACAECHRERVAEFLLTRHAHACDEPTDRAMPVGFQPGRGHFQSRDSQIQFEMSKTGSQFVQTAIRSHGTTRDTMTSKIDLVYGFPPTDEVYFTWKDNRLFELPVAWLHPTQEWAASTFNPDSDTDFSRPMSVRCLECHNTWFHHIPGTQNQYQRDHQILGVTCERCHGPGQDHVSFHRSNPAERAAHAIVHPGKLSRERLIEVCTQCHSNAIKFRGPAFSYRPGEPLEASFKTVSSRYPEDDHVANQISYLTQSKCFQKSDSMTCITCHNPHRQERVETEPSFGLSHSCIKCHPDADCRARTRLPAEIRDNCAGCHMPAHNKIQVYFDTETDSYVAPVKAYEHRIAVHPIAAKQIEWEWHSRQSTEVSREIAAQLANDLHQYWFEQAEKFRNAFRHLAAIDAYRQALRLKPSAEVQEQLTNVIAERVAIDNNWILAARQIRHEQFQDAAATLEELLRQKPDLAKAHGKLGTVFLTLGQRDRAIEHLEAVGRFDPDDAYGEGMLGWLSYREGKFDAAIEHYRRADQIEPYKAKIHYQWGLALVKKNTIDEAEQQFRQTLTIDPQYAEACVALSELLLRRGDLSDATVFARRGVKLTGHKQAEVLLHLAECLSQQDKIPAAIKVATEAIEIARQSQPDLVPRIQRRLIVYRNLPKARQRQEE